MFPLAYSDSKWLLVKKLSCHCHLFSFVIYLLFSPLSDPHFRFYRGEGQKVPFALKCTRAYSGWPVRSRPWLPWLYQATLTDQFKTSRRTHGGFAAELISVSKINFLFYLQAAFGGLQGRTPDEKRGRGEEGAGGAGLLHLLLLLLLGWPSCPLLLAAHFPPSLIIGRVVNMLTPG